MFTDIRLAGSGLSREGRLEVKVGGIWGTVCDDIFDDEDAAVACSMLGYGYVLIWKLCKCLFSSSRQYWLSSHSSGNCVHFRTSYTPVVLQRTIPIIQLTLVAFEHRPILIRIATMAFV